MPAPCAALKGPPRGVPSGDAGEADGLDDDDDSDERIEGRPALEVEVEDGMDDDGEAGAKEDKAADPVDKAAVGVDCD